MTERCPGQRRIKLGQLQHYITVHPLRMSNNKKKGQQKKIMENFLLSDVRNLFVKKNFYIPVSYNLGNINWFLIAVAKHWLNTVWTVPNCKILFKAGFIGI